MSIERTGPHEKPIRIDGVSSFDLHHGSHGETTVRISNKEAAELVRKGMLPDIEITGHTPHLGSETKRDQAHAAGRHGERTEQVEHPHEHHHPHAGHHPHRHHHRHHHKHGHHHHHHHRHHSHEHAHPADAGGGSHSQPAGDAAQEQRIKGALAEAQKLQLSPIATKALVAATMLAGDHPVTPGAFKQLEGKYTDPGALAAAALHITDGGKFAAKVDKLLPQVDALIAKYHS